MINMRRTDVLHLLPVVAFIEFIYDAVARIEANTKSPLIKAREMASTTRICIVARLRFGF